MAQRVAEHALEPANQYALTTMLRKSNL